LDQLLDQDESGLVSAELVTLGEQNGKPVLVSFQSPWPLFLSGGMECRDLRNPESAFVQVTTTTNGEKPLSKDLLMESVFSSSGKFGAYGSPYDIKLKRVEGGLYAVSFTTLTPGIRESERKGYISVFNIDNTVFMLVTSTLANRWKTQEPTLRQVAESFRATLAPQTSFTK